MGRCTQGEKGCSFFLFVGEIKGKGKASSVLKGRLLHVLLSYPAIREERGFRHSLGGRGWGVGPWGDGGSLPRRRSDQMGKGGGISIKEGPSRNLLCRRQTFPREEGRPPFHNKGRGGKRGLKGGGN